MVVAVVLGVVSGTNTTQLTEGSGGSGSGRAISVVGAADCGFAGGASTKRMTDGSSGSGRAISVSGAAGCEVAGSTVGVQATAVASSKAETSGSCT